MDDVRASARSCSGRSQCWCSRRSPTPSGSSTCSHLPAPAGTRSGHRPRDCSRPCAEATGATSTAVARSCSPRGPRVGSDLSARERDGSSWCAGPDPQADRRRHGTSKRPSRPTLPSRSTPSASRTGPAAALCGSAPPGPGARPRHRSCPRPPSPLPTRTASSGRTHALHGGVARCSRRPAARPADARSRSLVDERSPTSEIVTVQAATTCDREATVLDVAQCSSRRRSCPDATSHMTEIGGVTRDSRRSQPQGLGDGDGVDGAHPLRHRAESSPGSGPAAPAA